MRRGPSGEVGRALVLATRNLDKVRELSALAEGVPVVIRCLADFPGFPAVIEDGLTAEANAVKKARAASMLTGQWAAADDTALEVDALGGQPGVHAARYAGPECDYGANNRKLLSELAGVPESNRGARFVTAAALVTPGREPVVFMGERRGAIAAEPRGSNGFGYDPVFIDAELGLTFAEIDPATKNRISHRAAAFGKLFEHVAVLLEGE